MYLSKIVYRFMILVMRSRIGGLWSSDGWSEPFDVRVQILILKQHQIFKISQITYPLRKTIYPQIYPKSPKNTIKLET